MDPAQHAGFSNRFDDLRSRLNSVLAFMGYALGEDGKVRLRDEARTITEAENRAARLSHEMSRRGVHPDVLRFCKAELLQDNYFHAVFEATKSVAEKIRAKSHLTSDGAELAQVAFGGTSPLLAINTLRSDTEKSEQRGFLNLLIGMFGVFRNTAAHAPRIMWPVSEQDAQDLLSLTSYLHRRLDGAVSTSPGESHQSGQLSHNGGD